MTETAAAYAASIAEEVRLLDSALSGDVEAVAAFPGDDGRDWDEPDTFANYLNGLCLEVVYFHGSNGATIVEVLRTYGGPRCDIVRDSRDGEHVEVRAYWGGESAAVRVWAGRVADALDSLAENALPASRLQPMNIVPAR